MPDSSRPRLVAVESRSEERPPGVEAGAQRGGAERSRLVWVLAVALAASLVALGLQTQRTLGLEAEVESLSGQLETAQEEIEGFQGHLERVRERVSTLIAELEALEGFVGEGPSPSDP